jgi:NAD+ diphosphatase
MAHAVTSRIQLRDQELEDARWFSRAELAATDALLPPQQSISFRLIEHWFNAGGGKPLRDINGGTPWPASR